MYQNNFYTKMKKTTLFFLIISLISLQNCQPTTEDALYEIDRSVVSDSSMVVSPHPLASDVGAAILKQGGNAVDAAIAIQFAIAVVYPRAGNIGGGGFMVVRQADGTSDALDYREKAPMAAHRDMYLDSLGNPIDSLSRIGHLSVGVPGTVAGMVQAHQKYGKIKAFKSLVEPAIELARNGFRLTATEANRLTQYQDAFKRHNATPNAFIKEGGWKKGELLVQTDLANTLSLIAQKGKTGFYEGEIADKIVAEMKRGYGLITKEDLKNYEAKWRQPIMGNFKNYKVISMPPASSGGVALTQLLKIMEDYPIETYDFQSKEAVHLMVEAERRVYADRSTHLGDSDFYDVPIDSLLDKEYLRERMSNFNPEKATLSGEVGAGDFEFAIESFETTHTSVVDAQGNAVSVTTTLNLNFGSKVVVGHAGFFLNDEMDDFSAKPGVPNFFGLVGAEANAIEPGKRMLSSMTPSIIEKDGELFMVLGAPGGSTIITAVFQTFLNVAVFGMDLEQAVNAGRFHHQWLPDQILVEKEAIVDSTRTALKAMGHQFKEVDRMAVIKAIHKLPNGKLHGVSDFRNPDDDVEGY